MPTSITANDLQFDCAGTTSLPTETIEQMGSSTCPQADCKAQEI